MKEQPACPAMIILWIDDGGCGGMVLEKVKTRQEWVYMAASCHVEPKPTMVGHVPHFWTLSLLHLGEVTFINAQ